MGEAKRKSAQQALTPEQRDLALGSNAFTPAYDLIFGMVNAVFSKEGEVNHELIGLDFEAGKPVGVNVLLVKRIQDVPRLRAGMLEHWPMVAHVFEAWGAPDASVAPSAHPLRYDIVNIALHTSDMAAVGMCRADSKAKTVEKADLIYPDKIGGRLGLDLPTRH